MKSYYALSEANLAQYYLQSKGGPDYLPNIAEALVSDVSAYLRRSGLDHRLDEAAAIASRAFEIAEQLRQPVPGPEAVAWQDNIRSGTTADDAALQQMDQIALAGQVAAMDMSEYGANRARLGVTKDLASFLLGR